MHGTRVTCPLHNWVFDLATGQAQGADIGAVAIYPIQVTYGRLMLDAAGLMRRSAA